MKDSTLLSRIIRSIRTNIVVGIMVVTPVVATLLIFNFFFELATGWSQNIGVLKDLVQDSKVREYAVGAVVLLVILSFLYMGGLLLRNVLGRRLYHMGDRALTGIPVINGIYRAVRQISESLFTQRKTLFQRVVVIEYPRKGLHSIAFVTANLNQETSAMILGRKTREPCVTLFVPTTPNPTSGIMVIVPQSEVTPLDVPVADALTFVISAGAVLPGKKGAPMPTLLDKLEGWIRDQK